MPGIFLAEATPEPPPPLPDQIVWTANQHYWSANGLVYDIGTNASGVYLGAGVRGMNMPPIVRYSSKAPAVAGSRWRGSVTDEREVFWPMYVYNNQGSLAWLEHDRRFWSTMNPDRTGIWTVIQPDGEARTLTLRYVDDGNYAHDIASELVGWTQYPITLCAEQPYWSGEVILRTWRGDVPALDFFGGGTAPAFQISSASTLAEATLDNPGDVPAYPVWTLTGPFTTASVGVDGKLIAIDFPLLTGETLTIDTNPAAQTAISETGVDRTAELGPATDFVAVPSGASANLTLALAGTGTVSIALQPLFYRAV